ncbi:uncharacterized protein LOC115045601 [Echeneis naucrates]|uniref:uncharacterized protein LOC115045601 n=1 Tax=Echeneis naucrates TaxID=173247 RepID=UPI00111422FA|nr:uncharacterized protein LOC115045601 [Echeneis naucrates]
MASTPSASALSAVLRCRGNIWSRNPPTKRPVTSAYNLGLTGGAKRDFPAERARSEEASAWDEFLRGEHAVVGGRLAVAYKTSQLHTKRSRKGDFKIINKLFNPKPSHSPEDTRSAAPCVQNAPLRQLAHKLSPGRYICAKIIGMIKHQEHTAHICKIEFIREFSEFPAGVFKVSFKSPRFIERAGQVPSFVLKGWSALKSTCLSLSDLVSELMMLRLGGVWRRSSSSEDAHHHLQCQEDTREVGTTTPSREPDRSSIPPPSIPPKTTPAVDRPD